MADLNSTGKEQSNKVLVKVAFVGMFACYLFAVFGVTLLNRSPGDAGLFRLMPFYSYIEAWYQYEDEDWRNLILNIFMLVPFGLLLPYLHKKFRNFAPTLLAGLLFIICIETTQFILKRGILETDDLINNTLGTVIGYSFFRLADYLHKRIQKEAVPLKPVLLYQLPLVITTIAFITIFSIHGLKELGNLSCHHITRAHPESVTCNTEFDSESNMVYVYAVPEDTPRHTKGDITDPNTDLKDATPYKEVPIITEEEAYTRIAQGFFRFEPAYEPENIIVKDIFLAYEVDSKGFYQPIYILECHIDGEDTRLYTPAIR